MSMICIMMLESFRKANKIHQKGYDAAMGFTLPFGKVKIIEEKGHSMTWTNFLA